MRYQILQPFTVKTSQREIELQTGQIIILPEDKAIRLIETGKITPIERVAYKIYSELLGCCLWVVADDADIQTLRAEGITEPVYTSIEINKLKEVPEALKDIHRVKQVFPDSKVEDVKRGNNEHS